MLTLSLKDGGFNLLYRRRYTIGIIFATLFLIRSILYHVPETKFTIRENKTPVPFDYMKIVTSPNMKEESNLFALILVSSSPEADHRFKRDAIRKTWGDCSNLHTMYRQSHYLPASITCKLVFFIARSPNDENIITEAKKFNDILLVDYQDSYSAITKKLMVSFKWAATIVKPSYVLKTDDDVFIHTPKLLNGLLRETDGDFYGGIVLEGNKVVRTPNHRHYISKAQYKDDYYPPYCKGAMYVFSGNLLPKMLNAANYVPYMHVDDAFVGILMYYIGVEIENLHYFLHFKTAFSAFPFTLTDCALNRLIAVSDNLSPDMLYSIHDRIKATENMMIIKYLCYTDTRALVIVVCLIIIILVTAFNVMRKFRIIGFHYKQ